MSEEKTCQICQWERQPPLQGWVLQNRHWSVGVYPARQVPGWVVMQLRRHATSVADMTADELTSMGPTLAMVTRAIQSQTDAERVYFVSFGENHHHVHVLLIPRGPSIPIEHRSSALHVHFAEYVDSKAAAETAGRLKASLASMLESTD